MGSQRESTRILGLDGYRVERLKWEADRPQARVRIWIERRGIHGYECSGCRRRTWRVALLQDPREIGKREGRNVEVAERIRALRDVHAKKPGLLARLRKAGL